MKLVMIIPALNEERTVGKAVRGVPLVIPGINNIQVIVIDDGSTDRTAHVVQQAGVRNRTGRSGTAPLFRPDDSDTRELDMRVSPNGVAKCTVFREGAMRI